MSQTIQKIIEQKVMETHDLMEAKKMLTDDLKERFDAKVSFTLYQEIYSCFLSYRNKVGTTEYERMMKDKYIAVYHAVEQRLQRWKAATE